MLVIGLTGGIGMGKSTVAKIFARYGVPSFNADDAVHELQAPHGRAIPALAAAFPGTVQNGILDRAALRNIVLNDPAAFRRLEKIMHPLVARMQQKFRAGATRQRRRAILLDIPLLFENNIDRRGTDLRGTDRRSTGRRGANQRIDVTLTVSCPRDVQIRRVLRRGTMSAEQIATIIARQMPDAQKRLRADYVIRTGLSRFHTFKTVRRLIQILRP